ncbi:MAG: hypothetical protein U1E70_04915 [Acetobacteraceae bacterium]
MAPATETRPALQAENGALLRSHLLNSGDPCGLLSPPEIVPRVGAERNFRVPNLVFTCGPPS